MQCSDETFRIFGFQPGEIEPSLDLFYSMVHRDDFQILMDKIEDLELLQIVHERKDEESIAVNIDDL